MAICIQYGIESAVIKKLKFLLLRGKIMKESEFISNNYVYYIAVSPFLVTVTLIFFINRDWKIAMFFLMGLLIFELPLIIWRKEFLAKMLINENGITKYCGKRIIKELKWEDIKDALVVDEGQIIFSDIHINYEPKNCEKDLKNITINIYKNKGGFTYFFFKLCEYKNKIPVEIRCIDKLQPDIAKKLKKDNKILLF